MLYWSSSGGCLRVCSHGCPDGAYADLRGRCGSSSRERERAMGCQRASRMARDQGEDGAGQCFAGTALDGAGATFGPSRLGNHDGAVGPTHIWNNFKHCRRTRFAACTSRSFLQFERFHTRCRSLERARPLRLTHRQQRWPHSGGRVISRGGLSPRWRSNGEAPDEQNSGRRLAATE